MVVVLIGYGIIALESGIYSKMSAKPFGEGGPHASGSARV